MRRATEEPRLVKKILGADFELANSMLLDQGRSGDVDDAAKLLLAEILGFPDRPTYVGTAIEQGRRFLSGSGGSAYIDSGHLEMNCPEHASALDHPGHVHAALLTAR